MPPVTLFTPHRFDDSRGWFAETYNARREEHIGILETFVQDNQSFSAKRGTIRGIHFQCPPRMQSKLIRCARGAIMDYAIDLRRGSPTYGKHVFAELTAQNGNQLYLPVGFGHAFITLEDDTEISYKVTDFYSSDADAGIRWDCPDIGIAWPLGNFEPILSDKDRALPLLKDFESPFDYDGVPLQMSVIR